MSSHKINQLRDIKVAFIGDGTVGKSAIINRFTNDKFDKKYQPTVFDNAFANVTFKEKILGCNVLDIAGQSDFDSFRKLNFDDCDVFVLVCDITNPTSFDNLKLKWLSKIKKYYNKSNIVVCANKMDAKDDMMMVRKLQEEGKEIVTADKLNEFAKEIGAFKVVETSAKSGKNVKLLFVSCFESCFDGMKKSSCCTLL